MSAATSTSSASDHDSEACRRTELEMHDYFTQGDRLDLNGRPDSERIVHAESIVKLLLSIRAVSEGRRSRLYLKGADVRGELDLSYCTMPFPIIFESCTFTHPLIMREAKVSALTFQDCEISIFDGEHLRVEGDFSLKGSSVSSYINLSGAEISNDLHLSSARIGNFEDSTTAASISGLNSPGIKIHGNLDCEHLVTKARVTFEDAIIDGSVYLKDAHLECDSTSDEAMAFNGQGLTIGSQLIAHKLWAKGHMSFIDMTCAGPLEFNYAHLVRSDSQKEVLRLDRCNVGGSVFFNYNFYTEGVLHGIGMEIGGALYLQGASLGRASCTEPSNAVLIINRSKIKGGIIASAGKGELDPFIANGPISLNGVRVEGNVDFEGANTIGTCYLTAMTVTGSLMLGTDGFCSYKRGTAAIDLTGASIGQLYLHGAPQQGLVDLTGAHTEYLIDDPTDYVCMDTPKERFTVDDSKIVLNGLTYTRIHQSSVNLNHRIAWLREGTRKVRAHNPERAKTVASEYIEPIAGYVPQPWEHLAAAYRRVGLSRDARTILLERERMRNRGTYWSAKTFLWKAWNYFQDWTMGYGYRPTRVFYWIMGMLGIGWGYFGTNNPVLTAGKGNGQFSLYDTIVYPVDLLLPLNLGGRATWHPSDAIGTIIAVVIAVIGWLLSLAIIIGIGRSIHD